MAKKSKVLLQALQHLEMGIGDPAVEAGRAFEVDADAVDDLIARGFAKRPDEQRSIKNVLPTPVKQITAAEVESCLQGEIYPNLTPAELSPDLEPNVDLLAGKLSAHFGVYVPMSAAVRDKSWKEFRAANPDLFQPVPDAGQGDGKGDGQGSGQDGGTDGKAD